MLLVSQVFFCLFFKNIHFRGKGKLSQNTVLKLEEVSGLMLLNYNHLLPTNIILPHCQVNHGPVYEEVTDQPTEDNGVYYSSIHFPQTDVDPLDNMVQPHHHQQEQYMPYAVVCLKNRCT